MIESKRLPREFILLNQNELKENRNKFKNETQPERRARQAKCKQLHTNLQGMQRKRDDFQKKRNQLFRDRNKMKNDLKRLHKDARFWNMVDILFNAIGALVSGGSTLVVRQTAAQVIGLIGTILGLQTHERVIKNIITKIKKATYDHDRLTGEIDYFQRNIDEHYRIRKDLCCSPRGYVPY